MAKMAPEGILAPLEEQGEMKKKAAVLRSWVLFDVKGEKRILDLDKFEIMKRMQIHARDLRILDPLLSYPSTILGRGRAIVLNLEHIKAIITADEVLVRDPSKDNVVPIIEQLQRRLTTPSVPLLEGHGEDEDQPRGRNEDGDRTKRHFQLQTSHYLHLRLMYVPCSVLNAEFPFEFRALEVMLEAICSFLDARTTELEAATYPALDELTSKISSRNLDRVRKLKSAMTRLTNRVQKVRDELEQLLDDDNDMGDLYLSRKLSQSSSPDDGFHAPGSYTASPTIGSRISKASTATMHDDIEELEMLLEAYYMQIESTLNKLTTLREYIDDTEDYINIQLDNHRNQLIQLELLVSSGTVCLSVYSLVSAIFGMNIPYTWRENHGYVFKWVVIVTGMVCGSLFLSIMTYARNKGLIGC